MTYEEALKDINETLTYKVDELNDIYPNVWHETLIKCKEALEKQIPKKPKRDCTEVAPCPVCGFSVIEKVENFCPHCGQALDWSDKE